MSPPVRPKREPPVPNSSPAITVLVRPKASHKVAINVRQIVRYVTDNSFLGRDNERIEHLPIILDGEARTRPVHTLPLTVRHGRNISPIGGGG